MEEKFSFPSKLKITSFVLIGIGIIAFVWGFLTNSDHAWGNLLLNNFYFVSQPFLAFLPFLLFTLNLISIYKHL